jgi:hypothetical protein
MTIRFGLQTDSLSDSHSSTSDSQFLAAVEWRDSRPGIAREITSESDLKTIGMCWKQQCEGWDGKLDASFSILSIWEDSIPSELQTCRTDLLVSQGTTKRSKSKQTPDDAAATRLTEYIQSNSEIVDSNPVALLVCVELLCCASSSLNAAQVGHLWRAVLSAAVAQANSFQEAISHAWTNIDDEALDNREFLLASGLLPWVCGVLFDDVKGATKLAKSGRKGIAEQLMALTDSEGCLHDYAIRRASVFLALWRDGTIFGNLFSQPVWKSAETKRFAKFLAKTTAVLRVDGYLAVEGNADQDAQPSAVSDAVNLAALTDFAKSPKTWTKTAASIAAATAESGSKKRKSKKTPALEATYKKNDETSWQSDDSQTAVLRASWAVDSSIISLAHASPEPWIELAIDGVPLLSGDWNIDVAEDSEFLHIEEDWDCCCWYSDREVDYCEIDLNFEGGPKICRHLMLHRTKQFAVISDVVSDASAKRLDLETFLPLAKDVELTSVTGTREIKLQVGDKAARAYPLVLPQDRGIGTAGDAAESNEFGRALRIAQATNSGGLFSPVVIDWSPDRQTAEAEWAPLTVTEAGEIDSTGSAAYRLRVGDLHLVLYQELRKTERYRTVLGMLTESETIIGEYTKKGIVRELVVVQ